MRPVFLPTDQADNKAVNYQLYSQHTYRSVLELGPYDGTDTVFLARHAALVISLESREENIAATQERVRSQDLSNVRVLQANLENYDLTKLGWFDAVWASGIIYHLPHPQQLIHAIGCVTNRCYGWTHLTNAPTGTRDGYEGSEYPEGDSYLAGMSSTSWWLTERAFLDAWRECGMQCSFTTEVLPHPNGGLSAQFLATGEL